MVLNEVRTSVNHRLQKVRPPVLPGSTPWLPGPVTTLPPKVRTSTPTPLHRRITSNSSPSVFCLHSVFISLRLLVWFSPTTTGPSCLQFRPFDYRIQSKGPSSQTLSLNSRNKTLSWEILFLDIPSLSSPNLIPYFCYPFQFGTGLSTLHHYLRFIVTSQQSDFRSPGP